MPASPRRSSASCCEARDAPADPVDGSVGRDPFDRLLVCQSRLEPMLLLTVDSQLRSYGATVNVLA